MKIIDKDKIARIKTDRPKSNIMFGMIAFYLLWSILDRIVSVQVYEMFVTFTKTTYSSLFNFLMFRAEVPEP